MPAHSFLLNADKIRESSVFKIIQKMPKGTVLHAHDMAIVSFNYVFWNITFRSNLYVCDVSGQLKLQFFDKPNKDCEWMLLENVRKDDKNDTINHRIVKQLTMHDEHPELVYPDIDAAWKKCKSIFIFIKPILTYR